MGQGYGAAEWGGSEHKIQLPQPEPLFTQPLWVRLPQEFTEIKERGLQMEPWDTATVRVGTRWRDQRWRLKRIVC